MPSHPTVWRREVIGWSLYDFANTIYSMNILSLYLKRYVVVDLGYDDLYFDLPYAASMLLAGLLLPAMGAMSDHSTKKKLFILLFTITCCASVGLLAFIPPSFILAILVLFALSNFCFEAAQPFYNALLYSVSDGRDARLVSGIGVAAGYIGSVVGMLLVMPFVTGAMFGWEVPFIEGSGKSGSFLPTAFLFMLFALPLFLMVKDRSTTRPGRMSVADSYRAVWEGISSTRKYPGVRRFLIADYFFEDAVTTVILNIGLYCSIVIGLSEEAITSFLVISTVSAVGGSFLMGKIARVWSLKKLLNLIVYAWVGSLLLFVLTDNMAVVWLLGSVIGILLGGLWTTSRPMLAELVPKEDLGRFFGLFSLSGRAAAVVGPLVWGAVVYTFNADRWGGQLLADTFNLDEPTMTTLPYRLGVLSLVVMMAIGLFIFRKVPDRSRVDNG